MESIISFFNCCLCPKKQMPVKVEERTPLLPRASKFSIDSLFTDLRSTDRFHVIFVNKEDSTLTLQSSFTLTTQSVAEFAQNRIITIIGSNFQNQEGLNAILNIEYKLSTNEFNFSGHLTQTLSNGIVRNDLDPFQFSAHLPTETTSNSPKSFKFEINPKHLNLSILKPDTQFIVNSIIFNFESFEEIKL